MLVKCGSKGKLEKTEVFVDIILIMLTNEFRSGSVLSHPGSLQPWLYVATSLELQDDKSFDS